MPHRAATESSYCRERNGLHGSFSLQIANYQDYPINAFALTAMLKQIIANSRAGRWRKLKRRT